jgi:hypothetical protein
MKLSKRRKRRTFVEKGGEGGQLLGKRRKRRSIHMPDHNQNKFFDIHKTTLFLLNFYLSSNTFNYNYSKMMFFSIRIF